MIKIIQSLIIIGAIFFSSQLVAKTIRLAPNETKMLANNAPFTLKANCNVQASHPIKSKVKIVVLKNKGTINAKNLSSGQSTLVSVKNNTHISVSAEAGAQINLINLGRDHIEAYCML